jgi:hypothetical protein
MELLIEGDLLHKLNQFSEEKYYIIEVGTKEFLHSRIQIALLSPVAFRHFLHFVIEITSYLNSDELVSCFEQLNSLFHSTSE